MASGGAVVTGLAASTSLGGLVTACAAARAGLARPAPLETSAWDDDEGALPVVGHPVPEVIGFQGEARLLALGVPPLADLVREAAPPKGEEVALLVALPDLAAGAAAARVRPPPLRLLERLASAAGVPAPPPLRHAFALGSAGFAAALRAALDLLAAGTVRACVAGAIDTLCDDAAVAALAAARRLKSGENPVGLAPGEAAAFFLLETAEGARRRRAPVHARLAGVALAGEPRSGDDPPVGEGLFAAIRQLVASTGPVGGALYVLDRNGEPARANDWGCCLQRLAARLPEALPALEWDPATSFGDTGAASSALGVALAVRGFARRYVPGPCAVVLSSGPEAHRAALRVEGGA